MLRYVLFCIVGLFACIPVQTTDENISTKSIVSVSVAEKISNSTVKIQEITITEYGVEETSHGSGTIFKEDQENLYILTAKHVVSAHSDTVIHGIAITDEAKEKIRIISFCRDYYLDKRNDIAIVSVSKRAFIVQHIKYSIAPIATSEEFQNMHLGDTVYCCGYPAYIGKYITKGILSKKWFTKEQIPNEDLFMLTANVIYGNSGGGIFTKDGRLIGVTSRLVLYQGYLPLSFMGIAVRTDGINALVNRYFY